MIEDVLNKLEKFNDPKFKFEEKYHRYTYDGKVYNSVTRFIQNFHKPFEEEYWSNKKAEEAGVPQEWILKQWKEKNDRANYLGSETHNWIENYYKGIYQSLPNDIDIINRINKFNTLYAEKLYKLTPVSFEVRIFSKKYPIAGMLDSLFLYKGKLFIIDWKTNGIFTHDEHNRGKFEKLLSPFGEYWKNHLNEYSIQVSLYSLILEEWGIDVKGAYLVHIGPDTEGIIYKALNLKEYLRKYLSTYNW